MSSRTPRGTKPPPRKLFDLLRNTVSNLPTCCDVTAQSTYKRVWIIYAPGRMQERQDVALLAPSGPFTPCRVYMNPFQRSELSRFSLAPSPCNPTRGAVDTCGHAKIVRADRGSFHTSPDLRLPQLAGRAYWSVAADPLPPVIYLRPWRCFYARTRP
jgi:hypothetical protein